MMPTMPPRPTDAELAILRVLWAKGPSTVRHVLDALNEERVTGYTTVLKLLQIMTDKQLVARDESDRTHIYRASFSEADTQRQLLDDLMDRAFGGSAMQLVMRALSFNSASIAVSGSRASTSRPALRSASVRRRRVSADWDELIAYSLTPSASAGKGCLP